ncbi:hypothetical protein JCM15519_24100 [Fundidesulfovibrio butyratiphilus]
MFRLPNVLFGLILALTVCEPAQAEVHTFFPGTQYAIDVHFLRGAQPGPTVMVQGGIQGDESAGFLTAQLLTRAKVTKGTIIIVPRANPPSIHERKRSINVDLNRRFDKDYNEFYEDRLARLIRFLVGQSKALIHLHEGSGFYDAKQISDLRGPHRYGQSVIIDTVNYKHAIPLANMVREVLDRLNQGVDRKDFAFQLFNMDTFNDRSHYLEQRKSLTYYCLSNVGIPAVAVEVSKNITDLAWKVNQQMRATTLFLREFGVELEPPALSPADFQAYPPREYTVLVNGRPLDKNKPRLSVNPGSPLTVQLALNDSRNPLDPVTAVFASDRPGLNLTRAPRLPLAPFDTLDVRADGVVLAKAKLDWNGTWPAAKPGGPTAFVCWLGGKLKIVRAGQTLTAVQGDQLILEGVQGSRREEVLNLKGYVSRVGENDGQDAGQEIILDPKSFIEKFFLPCDTPGETLCEVVRETPGQPKDRFLIRLLPRKVQALILVKPNGETLTLPWTPGKPAVAPPGRYTLTDIVGNGPATMVQPFLGDAPLTLGRPFTVTDKSVITLRQSTTFADLGRMAVIAELPSGDLQLAQNRADGWMF